MQPASSPFPSGETSVKFTCRVQHMTSGTYADASLTVVVNTAPQCGSLVVQLQAEGCSGAVGSVCAVKAMQVVVRERRVIESGFRVCRM